MPHLDVRFGSICRPLKVQLKESGIPTDSLFSFQKDADAITRLLSRGVISEGNADICRNRLYRMIKNSVPVLNNKYKQTK